MVWAPRIPWPTVVDNTYPLWAALHCLSVVLPSQVIQKLLLTGILVLAGLGAHRLAQRWGKTTGAVSYFAGLLYVINPFVYGRFLTGQFLVLLGYALMPYFASALWNFLKAPGRRSAGRLLLWSLAVSTASIHNVCFMLLLSAVSLAAVAIAKWRQLNWRRIGGWGAMAAAMWLIASSLWLLPTMAGSSSAAKTASSFSRQQVGLFKTLADPQYGPVFNAAAMYGFWANNQGYYHLPKEALPVWPLIAVTFMVLALIGLWASRRDPEPWALATLGALALILGVGVSFGPFAGTFNWCFDHVPFFKGYREPQKFIGLLILAYSYLGAIGAQWVVRNARYRIALVVILVLPIIYTYPMFWGFSNQLRVANYPADWTSANQLLKADSSQFKVLFLPWHQYLTLDFAGGKIANPSQAFFEKPVIKSDTLEFGGSFDQNVPAIDKAVEKQILKRAAVSTDAGPKLARLNIKYVLLAKTEELSEYSWLSRQPGLVLLNDGPTLRVYINRDWRP
jgi:hypothetical protein